jgi:serine/threonine-protein kinase SRPK3
MPRKIKDGRLIYLSHNDLGPPKSFRILPKIAEFGLAQLGEGSEPLMHPIQPPLFYASEVLLGTSWTFSVDTWNLGVLVYFYLYYLSRVLLTRCYIDLEHDKGQGFIYTYSF